MKARMTLATLVTTAALGSLAACGTGDEPQGSPTSDAPSPSATQESPTPDSPATATDLVGDWRDDEADWTVHFAEDGSYVEDFEGTEGFRSGTYELKDGTVSLIGGDGNTDDGTVEGDTLVFNLGTLERQ